jgi:hypothetical protein
MWPQRNEEIFVWRSSVLPIHRILLEYSAVDEVTEYTQSGNCHHRVHIFTRDETGSVYLLERTLQLYW